MSLECTGKQLTKAWFENLERRLTEEADHAGLLQHPTLIGDAREFFVRQVLGTFLPSSLHIGTGRVIGAESVPSRQVDVVVFDARFPSFNMPDGTSLFPVEGVIAAIEVKSTVCRDTLRSALDNCLSVLTIGPGIVTEDLRSKVAPDNQGVAPTQIDDVLLRAILPRAYVFAFNGLGRPEDLNDIIREWFLDRNCPGFGARPFLPSIAVTGGAVAICYGDPITVSGAEWRDADNNPVDESSYKQLMWVLTAKQRFGWLATHLLFAAEQRRLQERAGSRLRLGFGGYLPFGDYFAEYAADEPRLTMALKDGGA